MDLQTWITFNTEGGKKLNMMIMTKSDAIFNLSLMDTEDTVITKDESLLIQTNKQNL